MNTDPIYMYIHVHLGLYNMEEFLYILKTSAVFYKHCLMSVFSVASR